ncbi:MAG: class I SAM-dependent methyltransferase [Lysobacterales bacterium]
MQASHLSLIPVFVAWFGSWRVRVERRPLPTQDLAAAYDQAAPTWTRLTERLGYARAYRRLIERFFAAHRMTIGTRPLRVLDCGVGTGGFSLALSRVWRRPVEITGIDISPAMVNAAQRRFHKAGLQARTAEAKVAELPFAAESFDLVIAAHVLEHLPEPAVALAEMQRVLRPGGWVVTCLTRRSWLGAYIQTKWRTHRLTHRRAESWLRGAGLLPSTMEASGGLYGLTSLTAIGHKAVTRLAMVPGVHDQ